MPYLDEPIEPPGWQLDELAYAGRENLDADHVASYDAKENADATAEVRLCERLGLTRESVVVELGAGTGQFTLAVAPECGRVVAVDVSPVMLTALRANVDRAALDNVEVVRGGFLTYEHEDRSADLIYTRYALHHLPDFWKAVALARIHRMLRPGGVLRLWDVVYGFDAADAAGRIEAWCAEYDTADDGGWNRADVEEHVRDEYSTFTWLLELMLERVGFAIEDADYSDDGIFAKYVLRRP
jgi:ubiquinone/menaquinone biosynthesis C-methylase UbiE